MRKLLCLLALCTPIALSSCGKEGEAASAARGPGKGSTVGPNLMPWDFPAPKGGPVTAMPKLTQELFRNVAVRVESVELDKLGLGVEFSLAGQSALSVKVVATSYLQQLKLFVEPKRFTLEDGDGNLMPMRISGLKEPVLPRTFLKEGQRVTGWLTFLIPEGQRQFTLKSNITRDPPVSIPIEVPTSE